VLACHGIDLIRTRLGLTGAGHLSSIACEPGQGLPPACARTAASWSSTVWTCACPPARRG